MTLRGVDVGIRRLAERQHGVVHREQARAIGLSRDGWARRLSAGTWEAATPRVMRLAGSVPTHHQRCMVAVLDTGMGAVASHRTAAWLWYLPGFEPPMTIEVSRPRIRSRRISVAVVHEPLLLPLQHCCEQGSIPVTNLARTIFDLAGCLHPRRAERALDNAVSRKLVTLEGVRSVAVELFEHGRTGSALMRRLLDERGVGYLAPESGLEAQFLAVVCAAGLETPERQVDLGDVVWIGRVDFLYRRQRLVIEVDSIRHHSTKLDRDHDAHRDAALRAAGFRVLRIHEQDIWERPDVVVAQVRDALKEAAA